MKRNFPSPQSYEPDPGFNTHSTVETLVAWDSWETTISVTSCLIRASNVLWTGSIAREGSSDLRGTDVWSNDWRVESSRVSSSNSASTALFSSLLQRIYGNRSEDSVRVVTKPYFVPASSRSSMEWSFGSPRSFTASNSMISSVLHSLHVGLRVQLDHDRSTRVRECRPCLNQGEPRLVTDLPFPSRHPPFCICRCWGIVLLIRDSKHPHVSS